MKNSTQLKTFAENKAIKITDEAFYRCFGDLEAVIDFLADKIRNAIATAEQATSNKIKIIYLTVAKAIAGRRDALLTCL